MVILGVAAASPSPRGARLPVTSTRIGGPPSFCGRSFSSDHVVCRSCGGPMRLMLQAYAPVDGSSHRVIHLLACTRAQCSRDSRGWRALRSQTAAAGTSRPAPPPAAPAPAKVDEWEVADEWGGDGSAAATNDFNDDAEFEALLAARDNALSAQPATSSKGTAAALAALSLDEGEKHHGAHVAYLDTCYELFSVAEAADLDAPTEHEMRLLREYEREHGSVDAPESGDWEGEGYEKVAQGEGSVDDALIKFTARVSAYPRQCMRYATDESEKPLKFHSHPSLTPRIPAPCASCGGARMFELQLMPATIALLFGGIRDADEAAAQTEPEFGTVLVYSCIASCAGSADFVDELVHVHPDK